MTAGLSALGSSHIVIIGGLAELFSGAISMGIGGYFSTKAERDNYNYLLRQAQIKLQESSVDTFEGDVFDIFSPYGLDHINSQNVARCLWEAESRVEAHPGEGLTSFVLKFGEGVEPISTRRVYASAITIALSYFVGGIIPMVNKAPPQTLILDPLLRHGRCISSSLRVYWCHRCCSPHIWCCEGLFDWIEKGMDLVGALCN